MGARKTTLETYVLKWPTPAICLKNWVSRGVSFLAWMLDDVLQSVICYY